MDFGQVIKVIKDGKRVARKSWKETGAFIFLVPGSKFKVNRPPLLGIYPEGTEIVYRPHIDTRWWHDFCMRGGEIHFIKGRLKFGNAKHSAPFPSAIVIFRPQLDLNGGMQ